MIDGYNAGEEATFGGAPIWGWASWEREARQVAVLQTWSSSPSPPTQALLAYILSTLAPNSPPNKNKVEGKWCSQALTNVILGASNNPLIWLSFIMWMLLTPSLPWQTMCLFRLICVFLVCVCFHVTRGVAVAGFWSLNWMVIKRFMRLIWSVRGSCCVFLSRSCRQVIFKLESGALIHGCLRFLLVYDWGRWRLHRFLLNIFASL